MTFNINGPSNKPVITEAQNMMNNGGGGNTGYFEREQEQEAINFIDSSEEDSFKKTVDLEEDDDDILIVDRIIEFFKKMFKAIANFFSPKKKIDAPEGFITFRNN